MKAEIEKTVNNMMGEMSRSPLQEQDEPSPDHLDTGPPEGYEPPREVRDLVGRFAEWIGGAWPGGEAALENALRDISWAMAMDTGLDADFTSAVQATRDGIRADMEAEEPGR